MAQAFDVVWYCFMGFRLSSNYYCRLIEKEYENQYRCLWSYGHLKCSWLFFPREIFRLTCSEGGLLSISKGSLLASLSIFQMYTIVYTHFFH